MKLKKILVSAVLSLALGITAFAVAAGTKAEKVQEVEATSNTLTFDSFNGLPDGWPIYENNITLQGYTFKYKQVTTDDWDGYYGYGRNNGFTLDRNAQGYVNNTTAMPGDIVDIKLYTYSNQGVTINYKVAFGTSELSGRASSNVVSHSMAGGANQTFTCPIDGAKYFSIYCDSYASSWSCVDKIVVTYAEPDIMNLKVNDNWFSGNARFAAYFYGSVSSDPVWADMSLVSGSTKLFEVEVPDTYTQVIFGRMNPDTSDNNFNEGVCWNQSNDLTFGSNRYFLMYDGYWKGDNAGIWHAGTDNVYLRGTFTNPQWNVNGDQLSWNNLSGQYELKAYNGLAKDDEFKVFDITSGSDAGYVAEGMTNDYDLFHSNDGNIVCTSDTSYDIYYKPQHNAIWIEENATVAATHFAGTFLTVTGGICKDSSAGQGDTDLDALKAAWNAKGDGTTLVDKWNVLSSGAKGVFASGTGHADIVSAVARYRVIMGRYAGTLTAFTDGPELAGGNALVTSETSTTNQTLIIAIVAALTIVSVGGFVFIRRRREN